MHDGLSLISLYQFLFLPVFLVVVVVAVVGGDKVTLNLPAARFREAKYRARFLRKMSDGRRRCDGDLAFPGT